MDRGRDGRNGLVTRGCRGRQGLTEANWGRQGPAGADRADRGRQGSREQVKGGKPVSEGRAVDAGGMEACLDRRSKAGTRVKNWVRRAVQLSVRMAGGKGSQYTEGGRVQIQKTVKRRDGVLG